MSGSPNSDCAERMRNFLAEITRDATPEQIEELLSAVSRVCEALSTEEVQRLRSAFMLGAESCPAILDVIDGNLALREFSL
jgi:hypothetical protein